MSKVVSFLKVLLKNSFSRKKGNKSSFGLLALIGVIILFYVYTYTNIGIDYLQEYNLSNVVPIIAYVVTSLYIITMSFTKTKNIIFNSKDNEMVFSLPISSSKIFITRMLTVYINNCLASILVFLASSIFYGIRMGESAKFYAVALIFTILVPLIPTAISVIISYIIASITKKMKSNNIFEIVLNFAIIISIFLLVYNAQAIFLNFVSNQEKILKFLDGVGCIIKFAYDALINLDITSIVIFITSNILLFLLVSLIFCVGFKKIILSQNVNSSNSKSKVDYVATSRFIALVRKEIKLYTSSTLYFVNTFFGVILMLGFTIYMAITSGTGIDFVLKEMYDVTNVLDLRLIIIFLFIFMVSMTNTACSSISIEAKKIWILKTIPVSKKDILKSKIVLNMLVVLPFALICATLLCVIMHFNAITMLLLDMLLIVINVLCSIFGIMLDLKSPILEWQTEAEVVKQNKNVFIATFIPMILVMMSFGIITFLSTIISLNLVLAIVTAILIILAILYYKYFNKNCEKYFYKM